MLAIGASTRDDFSMSYKSVISKRERTITREGSVTIGLRIEREKIAPIEALAIEAGLTRCAWVRSLIEAALEAADPLNGVQLKETDQQLLEAALAGRARQLSAITNRLEAENP
jgi:hypothetical protein